ELVKDWRTREPFAARDRAGMRVCDAMAKRGVLTRPIGNVLVIMTPYCTTTGQMKRVVSVLHESIDETLGKNSRIASAPNRKQKSAPARPRSRQANDVSHFTHYYRE